MSYIVVAEGAGQDLYLVTEHLDLPSAVEKAREKLSDNFSFGAGYDLKIIDLESKKVVFATFRRDDVVQLEQTVPEDLDLSKIDFWFNAPVSDEIPIIWSETL